MNTRTEPTLGNLDTLEVDDPTSLVAQTRAALNANVSVATEDVEQAKKVGMSPAIARAQKNLLDALAKAQAAAELLAEACGAEAAQLAGAQQYLKNDQKAGDRLFAKAAETFRAIKPRAVELAFSLSDLPGETWDRIAKRVNNSLVSTITAAGSNIQARKESIQAWGTRLAESFDRTVDRINAVPGQIADRIRATGESVKDAALTVVVKFLRWGARKEDAIRQKVASIASLGEAALATGTGVIKGIGEQVKSAGQRFDNELTAARSRRNP
jgi:hypothetical protein